MGESTDFARKVLCTTGLIYENAAMKENEAKALIPGVFLYCHPYVLAQTPPWNFNMQLRILVVRNGHSIHNTQY